VHRIRLVLPVPVFSLHAALPPQIQRHPAKLASRMKRRFRIVLMRKSGQVLLGTAEAADPQAAEKVAAIQFELDEFQRRRPLVQEERVIWQGQTSRSGEFGILRTRDLRTPSPRPDLASAAGAGVSQPPARCAAVCCPAC
jgi:hypothetical protein